MTKGALNVGAGTGISASFARLLAKEGYKIVLASRDPGKFERLARETGATCCAADTSDPAPVDGLSLTRCVPVQYVRAGARTSHRDR